MPASDTTGTGRGLLIVNADDWGGWKSATDAALACHQKRRITSVSAMVFMEDSERAAALAKDSGVDVGLHVNFTQRFSDDRCPARLVESQERICRFLKRSKYALLIYHPFLREQFRDVYQAQAEEFLRLYGRPPSHFDGHQHMHLSSNMLLDGIIPTGLKVRRSFSFFPGEKSWLNRLYRGFVDKRLARRYRVTDYFFALSQSIPNQRLARIAELARTATVELMTHPEKPAEYEWLMSDDCLARIGSVQTGSYASL